MYTIQKYIKDTITLTNSIIIKFKDTAYFVNKRIENYFGITIDSDPTTWKYYLNLSGQKHFTNTDVKIYLLETDKTVSLTKEILEANPLTKEELLKQETMYNQLLLDYPNDIDYIKGCMFPINIDDAINAEDGTILSYNRAYVEDRELSLINELEEKIKNFIDRWHVRAYQITDDLYISSFTGVLYSVLPSYIMNIRLNNIKTNKVHSFHLEHYFRSNLNLWDDIKILNDESILWLYKNLEFLISNIGKNETLNIIAKKIFESNKIGLGVYNLLTLDPAIDDNNLLNKNKPIYQAKSINEYYSDNNEFNNTIDNIIGKELHNDLNLTREINELEEKNIVNINNNKLINSVSDINTKIIDVNTLESFELYGNNLITNLLDYWLEFSHNPIYTKKINFIDPNTNKNYLLSPKEGLYFLYHMLAKLNNSEDKRIKYIESRSVINTELTYDEATNNIMDSITSKNSLTKIYNKIPVTISSIKSPDEFNNYFSKLIDLYITGRVEDANINNPIVSNDIKILYKNIRKYKKYYLEDKTFLEILEDNDITIELSDEYDYLLTILTLTETFTKVKIDNTLELINTLKSYINILLKLTSYTTQIVSDDINNNTIKAPYTTAAIVKTTNGIVNLNSGHMDALEQEYTKIKAHGNDFKEHFKIDKTITGASAILGKENIGNMSIFNYTDFNIKVTSTLYATIDKFYNMMVPEVSSRALNILDTLLNIINHYTGVTSITDKKDIGNMYNSSNNFNVNDNQNTIAEIKENISTMYYPDIESKSYQGDNNIKSEILTPNTTTGVKDITEIGITNNKYKNLDTNTLAAYAEIIDNILTNYYPDIESKSYQGDNNIKYNKLNENLLSSKIDTREIGIVINKYKNLDVNNSSAYVEIIDKYLTEYHPELKSNGINGDTIINEVTRLQNNNTSGVVDNSGVVAYTTEPKSDDIISVNNEPNTSVTLD